MNFNVKLYLLRIEMKTNFMEQKKIQIIIEGYNAAKVDNTVAWIFRKFSDAGVKITNNKVFLPNKREIFTVLKSPRGHKSAQQHLGRITHRRLIQVSNIGLVDLNRIGLTGSYPQFSKEVRINVKI